MAVARLVPVALRLGALATAAYAAWRVGRAAGTAARTAAHTGRLDQRAEDALDTLDDGLAVHRSRILGDADDDRQTNASARFRRKVRIAGHAVEIDASAIARLRLRRL